MRAKELRALVLLKGFSPAREIIRRVQSDAAVVDLGPSAITLCRCGTPVPPKAKHPAGTASREAQFGRLPGFGGFPWVRLPTEPYFLGI